MSRVAGVSDSSSIADRWLERHPEWWALMISAAAWLALAIGAHRSSLMPLCAAAALQPAPFLDKNSPRLTFDIVDWSLMMAAMMTPLVVLPLRHVAFRSYRHRRHYAIAEFLAGYLGLWIIVGAALPVLFATAAALHGFGPVAVAAVAYSSAAAWQLTPFKRRALQQCHRTIPLAADGWRADIDCVSYGIGSAKNCLVSCSLLMAAPMLASHGPAAMACIQILMLRERYQRRPRTRTAESIVLLCGAFAARLAQN